MGAAAGRPQQANMSQTGSWDNASSHERSYAVRKHVRSPTCRIPDTRVRSPPPLMARSLLFGP